MDAPDALVLIFVGIVVWLFATLFLLLVRQRERSPLRTMLVVIASSLIAIVLGLFCYALQ